MSVHPSRVLRRLGDGGTVLGAAVLPEAWHVDMIGLLGFDFAWIDAEHNNLDDRDLPALCLAARGCGCDPIVRITRERISDCYRALEAGAAGIMLPHCDRPEDARVAARNVKFAPAGERSYSGTGVDARYGLLSPDQYVHDANRESLLVVQIETPEAVESCDEIAGVAGVDVLMIGAADLSTSLGTPMQFETPVFQRAVLTVKHACDQAGKPWGMPILSPEQTERSVELGARFLCLGSPRRILAAKYSELRKGLDTVIGERSSGPAET